MLEPRPGWLTFPLLPAQHDVYDFGRQFFAESSDFRYVLHGRVPSRTISAGLNVVVWTSGASSPLDEYPGKF